VHRGEALCRVERGSKREAPHGAVVVVRRWLYDERRYVVVLDAGSSGTRLHVYQWARARRGEHLPRVVELRGTGAGDAAAARVAKSPVGAAGSVRLVRAKGSALRRTETEPGLDALAHNTRTLQAGVHGALQPLLHWAMAEVPRSHPRGPRLPAATIPSGS
jgi:hypothetical protein